MTHATRLAESLAAHGKLSLRHFPANARVAFATAFVTTDRFPWLLPSPEGAAVLLTSPLFLYALRGVPWRAWRTDVLATGSVLAVLATGVPLLFYFNSGWVQFGYRYLLDPVPFLLILTALGLRGRVTGWTVGLLAASIAVTGYGTLLFHHGWTAG